MKGTATFAGVGTSRGNTRTVDIHVLRLRKKLGLDNEIRTIFKIGYIFEITD